MRLPANRVDGIAQMVGNAEPMWGWSRKSFGLADLDGTGGRIPGARPA
jgi:hypothetical protein